MLVVLTFLCLVKMGCILCKGAPIDIKIQGVIFNTNSGWYWSGNLNVPDSLKVTAVVHSP